MLKIYTRLKFKKNYQKYLFRRMEIRFLTSVTNEGMYSKFNILSKKLSGKYFLESRFIKFTQLYIYSALFIVII